MDEWIKEIVAQTPIAGVLLFALWTIYNDLKQRMEAADAERKVLIDAIIDNTRRTKLIERETTGETTPTLPKRPA
jgi:hypothetical protein